MRVCARIGERLSQIRSERNLGLDDLSITLLLSIRQVRALEGADPSAFHNASFFMIALRKYAALCGIDRASVDAAVVAPPDVVQIAPDTPTASRGSVVPSREWTPIVAVLVACVVLGMGWGAFRWSRSAGAAASSASTPSSSESSERSTAEASTQSEAASTAPLPGPESGTAPQDSTTIAPPGEVPAAAPPSRGAGALNGQIGYGLLWSPQRAWMFLRLEDDTVIERTVNAGELVELPSKPKYLAIGSDEAELTIGFTPVDVSRFIQRGTLRMGVFEFGLAEQAAFSDSPIVDRPR
ncbi:MAG: helix-turn-helix domain-containing protein [Vicinamibacterales bacterium]